MNALARHITNNNVSIEAMEKKVCPICMASTTVKAKSIEGYRRGLYFDILECNECGVGFTDPMKVDEVLYNAIYSNVEHVPGYAGYFELAKAVEVALDPLTYIANSDACYFGVVKHIRDTVDPSAATSIVEIGCGQGYLTYALNKSGYATTGVDISDTVIGLAKTRYGDHYFHGDITSFVRGANEKPSIIICTELIEHLTDPVALINIAMENLPSGGRLILTTPHKVAGESGIWDTELPPIHLWWFTRKSLEILGNNLGIEVKFVDLSDFYDAHPAHRYPPQAPKKLGVSFFDESYQLVVRVKRRSPLRSKLRQLEKWIKTAITPLFPPSRDKQRVRCTDATSISICAVFTKK